MKGIGRQWRVSLVSAFVLCPGAAMAADGPSGVTAAIPTVAIFLALVVAVLPASSSAAGLSPPRLPPCGWYDSFWALLCGIDRDSLEQAVDGLRQNRHDVKMAVKTRDGARTFSVCGDSIIAGAVGAAVLLISDRSADRGNLRGGNPFR